MNKRFLVAAVFSLGLVKIAVAAFTPHPSGVGIVDDFDETTPDTTNWAVDPDVFMEASHADGVLMLNATIGFNQVYTTTSQQAKTGQILSAEMARIDSNTFAGDRVITNLSQCTVTDDRCFSDADESISYAWSQNDGYRESHTPHPGIRQLKPNGEMINIEVRGTSGTSIAGSEAPLISNPDVLPECVSIANQPNCAPEDRPLIPLDPNSFAPRNGPGIPTPDHKDAGFYDPMIFGDPQNPHFYRFEHWRTPDGLRLRLLDFNPDPEGDFTTLPVTIVHEATMDWSQTGPGQVADPMFIQLYVHHTINKTDNVWLRPHLLTVYEQVLNSTASEASDSPVALEEDPDLNGDGNVDVDDIDLWLQTYGTFQDTVFSSIRGDLNLDFVVDILDFGIFAGNFGSQTNILGGDLNAPFDELVDITDFGIFAGNFGFAATTVPPINPEPTTCALLGLGGLALHFRRRR